MNQQHLNDAATTLWRHFSETTRLDALPPPCRPASRADAYAVQREVARLSGRPVAGWKIAATSEAGQKHIGVDGPIAARLLSERVIAGGLRIPMDSNVMNVAEAEFAFRMARALPPRAEPYRVDEVMDAVGTLHLAIEVPDSRYLDFASVGALQLIADGACASWLVVSGATPAAWRDVDLVGHRVRAYRNGELAGEGSGANVLGDPRIAMTWLANELSGIGEGLQAGHIVTTGACVAPMAVAAGDSIEVDFGVLGTVQVGFA
ncbi:2-keto-4-pentenoate hydratase [Paraburkholderia caballeronis]|uniref:2-keto-4-pentenoate hydratase n=1 Tax=Paraburkholderia caballeronis TaxID=416943 RepID=UPI0010667779|nr:fumarylacetoacetate hydrolase family protein [Paraburkholderia caballeronis]TDV35601.1 2-keto-4-pentenoate hydratase [Paraburkholderia caballeronis]